MTSPIDAPLHGVRVVELGQIAAGPFAGMLLADLGADVVKVERPGSGDDMREWPPIMEGPDGGGFSANFASLNRNKRSVVADLKRSEDLNGVRALCTAADVVLENYRPGVLDRVGLGYEQLKDAAPRLVYCSLSGYGQEGPYSTRGAFDVAVQAMSGIMSCTGDPDGSPVKCGVPIGDFVAGLYAAYSILAALARARTAGVGCRIDCSMLGSLLGIAALQTSEYFGTGRPAQRLGSAHPRNAPYQAFDGSDKPFVIAAGNDKLWREVCAAVDMPALAEEPRFATQALRARNQGELAALLQPVFLTHTASEWQKEFDARGVPCAPIYDFAEALADPHVKQMGVVHPLELPNGVVTTTIAFPVKLSGFDFEVRRPPPLLGEHNAEVFDEWLGGKPDGSPPAHGKP